MGDTSLNRSLEPAGKPGRRRWGVVVVEPLAVVRAGIGLLVDRELDLEVLATVGDAQDALDAVARSRRTRIIAWIGLDLRGDSDATWLIREIRDRHPTHAILAVGSDADAAGISRALFHGADGFVDKEVEPEAFIEAIRQVRERETVLVGPPPIAIGLIAERIERRRDLDAQLTPREREVLAVAAEGLTAKQIAVRLGVRERTVTTHLGRIYGKLGVGGRMAAVQVAARSGLVDLRTGD